MRFKILLACCAGFSFCAFARAKVYVPSSPYLNFLKQEMNSNKKISYDLHEWFRRVTGENYLRAAQTWPALHGQIDKPFQLTAEATRLFLLYKLGMAQTFVDQWVNHLAEARFEKSGAEAALEAEVTPGFEAWLLQNPVLLSKKNEAILAKIHDDRSFIVQLKALAADRDVQRAEVLLPKLESNDWLSQRLATTLIYRDVKKGNLQAAAGKIKKYLEPYIAKKHDLEKLASKDLTVARLLYQTGNMNTARDFYLKIPNSSKSYLTAHEELAWVYLRTGDTSRLRGEVAALTSPLFDQRFAPESYVVRAVSNIKLCFYDKLEADFADFKRVNTLWAKKIDQALAQAQPSSSAALPPEANDSWLWARRLTERLEAENKAMRRIEGMTADGSEQIGRALKEARSREAAEQTRFWSNRKKALHEAIRKMRFIRLEYMSEVRELAKNDKAPPLAERLIAANTAAGTEVADIAKSAQVVFPVDNDIWTDELFRMRSTAQMNCLKNGVKR